MTGETKGRVNHGPAFFMNEVLDVALTVLYQNNGPSFGSQKKGRIISGRESELHSLSCIMS